MDKQKTVAVARKVESLAIGFIGVFFFSTGTSYFRERLLYHVPRILMPVFDALGNIGLAIGLLILAGGIIYYGFTKWKAVAERKNLYWILAAAGLVVGVAVANINFNPNKSAEITERVEKRREAQIDEVRNLEEKSFNNIELNEQIAKYDALYKRFEQSVEQKDEDGIAACEEDFNTWYTELAGIVEKLSIEEKMEFAPYMAKYSVRWNDLRMKAQEN
jgi:hypothetical protein